jgi:hypothetical protein
MSGSVYEVDTEAKKIRRFNGKKDPTPRQGKDGEWRGYLNNLTVEVGESVVIAWSDAHQLTEETLDYLGINEKEAPPPSPGRTTFTSPVVEVDSNVYN